MTSAATTPAQYVKELPDDRKKAFTALRKAINENIPEGFKEVMQYGMPGWVVPHDLYQAGYHVDPTTPLPFAALASQKNFIAFYHMAIYADPTLLAWFQAEFPKHSKSKLDMGKSCIRFKKMDDIPVDLIGELMSKIPVKKWVELYESSKQEAKKKTK